MCSINARDEGLDVRTGLGSLAFDSAVFEFFGFHPGVGEQDRHEPLGINGDDLPAGGRLDLRAVFDSVLHLFAQFPRRAQFLGEQQLINRDDYHDQGEVAPDERAEKIEKDHRFLEGDCPRPFESC